LPDQKLAADGIRSYFVKYKGSVNERTISKSSLLR